MCTEVLHRVVLHDELAGALRGVSCMDLLTAVGTWRSRLPSDHALASRSRERPPRSAPRDSRAVNEGEKLCTSESVLQINCVQIEVLVLYILLVNNNLIAIFQNTTRTASQRVQITAIAPDCGKGTARSLSTLLGTI